MKLGTNDIGSVYLGTNAVQKVYLGSNEVWSSYAYLLDDYSGAAAAYSLRLLRSAYTGSAIEVRRASDNSTQDIGFVNNELDVSTLESFCSGTNGFLTKWYDQSGNGYDATQTTAANQPQIVSSGSVILENGKPSINFDGSDDFLQNTSFNTTAATSGMSHIRVYSTNVDAASNQGGSFYSFGNSGNTSDFICHGATTAIFGEFIAFALNRTTNPAWRLASSTYRRNLNTQVSEFENWLSSGFDFYQNNSNVGLNLNNIWTTTDDSRPSLVPTDQFALGCLFRSNTSLFQQQKAQEYIFWFSDESSNRTGIEDNINDFYSIY